ncbi:MAG: beta-glucosidase BglX [Bacteroidetes bacterium]|nr:beta-glucosidase BglX [Bacteroidota bacterium]
MHRAHIIHRLLTSFREHRGSVIAFSAVLFFAVSTVSFAAGRSATSRHTVTAPYLNPKLPVEERVKDLLSRMTLSEKVGQMCQYSGFTPGSMKLAREGLVGSFLNIVSPKEMYELQTAAVKESRLGIPLLFGLDVIHGYSTIFPIPLAQASTWDPRLVKRCAEAAAEEAHSQGIRWTFSPMVDIARDPRWGRIAEGAGEDPYLGMVMAQAYVHGYQGDSLSPQSKLVACAKHYVAYGAAEGGRDYNTSDVSQITLRDVYLPPFKAAIDAGAGTIMSAFDDLDGVPASANPFTLRTILKGEWRFKGFVVSDWDAIGELIAQGIACDSAEATQKAVEAGVDMDMVGPYHDHLEALVKCGKVPISLINDAVGRILRIKFKLGLFENPYIDVAKAKSSLMRPEYLKLARQEAREAIVLLKNKNHLLPLSKDVKSIAVIGPLADDKPDMLGSWYCQGKPEPVVSLLEGIKAKLKPQTKLYYAKGCGITDTSTAGFADALEAAKKADVVIMAVGESGTMTGEAESRAFLNIPGVQVKLVKQIVALGKPVVEVLMSGRPLSISWSAGHVPAILETWFLGTEAGNAIADVLFGDYNPSGKLTTSFPRTVGQVPIFYDHMNTGRPASPTNHYSSKYIDLPIGPQYPFGFGLSYTEFKFSNLRVEHDPNVADGFIVTADVQNVGNRAGAEVAQLYIRQKCASVTRPVEQLEGFKRVEIEPGQSKTVRFKLTPYEISFINAHMKRVIEAGVVEIMVGGSSASLISTTVSIPRSMSVSDKVEIQYPY